MFSGLFGWFVKKKTGAQVDRFAEQGEGPYLILYNHQTPYDQFFVMSSFRGPVYYLATEDLFSNGIPSYLLMWSVAPIPIIKHSSDRTAILLMFKVAQEGGTLAIAPEGNRTYSGKTEWMSPAIGHVAQKLHLPIVLYRIEGGYGAEPRWADELRKGKIHAYVSRVIQPEEMDQMTDEELFKEIQTGLYVNEAVADSTYLSDKKAEYLERCVYVCPDCGLTTFESHGDEIECLTCHKKVRYFDDKHMEGVRFDFPFRFVNDWYEYQQNFINHLDVLQYLEKPLYEDHAMISQVIVYKKKQKLRKDASLKLYGDRVVIDEKSAEEWVIPFDEVKGMAICGRNKLNIYHNGDIYQFRGETRFNALKYVNIYYRHKNMTKETKDGEFLGL